jgi:CRISPR-associated endonuclease Csn1
MSKEKLSIAYDIGHSSIGWAVLNRENGITELPAILGCGSVTFPADDCLASARRGHRRTRRNIRATRQRIKRIKQLLHHLEVLTEEQLDAPGNPAPHVLAARALLSKKPVLDWMDIWNVLRWYAHNRGYDGNSRWARNGEQDSDDTEKEKAARNLMNEHGTTTMAETICAVLGINPSGDKISSNLPYRTLDAAFPREIVRAEVLQILNKHKSYLDKLNDDFIKTLISPESRQKTPAWATIPVPSIKLPRRYTGGLLFGQLIPRFDNRIISECPISGDKVPNKATSDFLNYRWAMIVANLRADGKPLDADTRKALHKKMEEHGRLTPSELRKNVEELTRTDDTNVEAFFGIHPDSKDALILDPALALFHGEGPGSLAIRPYWQHLPEISQRRAMGRWKKGRPVNLEWMVDQCEREKQGSENLEAEIQKAFDADQKKTKPSYLTKGHFLCKRFAPKELSGRAPYSRKIMRAVVDFVFSTNRHPTEAEKPGLPAGPIYSSKEVLNKERERPIDKLTNNHLIRQRLTILDRLTKDIIDNYADGDTKKISDIVVEVARDLQEYSGLTAKEMSGELTKRLSHFKSAVKYLEEHAPDLPISGSLIRKSRIAMDMDWKCPFTGKRYDAADLPSMEREHIIPYADRPTNALDALVLTFDWVNKLKGKRTALQFINDMADDGRFQTPNQYKGFIEKLKVAPKFSHPDDFRRQSARKKWLLLKTYDSKDSGFTAGALTQTSHLNRLSARQLESLFTDPRTGDCTVHVHSIPGQVTGEIRKKWNLLHCLDVACPECAGKNKTEIRGITHLHHALDAATLALAHHFLPSNSKDPRFSNPGDIWRIMLKRRKTAAECEILARLPIFKKKKETKTNRKTGDEYEQWDVCLEDIASLIKRQLTDRLAECRVVQHVPSDQSGAKLKESIWRVLLVDGEQVLLTQRPNRTLLELEEGVQRKWKDGKADKKTLSLLDRYEKDILEQADSASQRQKLRHQVNLIKRGIQKLRIEKTSKVIGLSTNGAPSTLLPLKGCIDVDSNYGMALDPEPTIIPFYNVPQRLAELKKKNSNEPPRILRNGVLIHIKSNPPNTAQDYTGIWKIVSLKNNESGLALDIVRPSYIKPLNGVDWSGMNKGIKPFLVAGLEILTPPLTGFNPSD